MFSSFGSIEITDNLADRTTKDRIVCHQHSNRLPLLATPVTKSFRGHYLVTGGVVLREEDDDPQSERLTWIRSLIVHTKYGISLEAVLGIHAVSGEVNPCFLVPVHVVEPAHEVAVIFRFE